VSSEHRSGDMILCETGFNGGHSAMMFMAFNELEVGSVGKKLPAVHYYGWDLGEFASAKPTAAEMSKIFPGEDQFKIIWGDTKETLKSIEDLNIQCHLIVIDGEHTKDGVINDLTAMLKIAVPGALVFVDDCAMPNKGIIEAFDSFVDQGQLAAVARCRNPQLGSPGFVEALAPDESGQCTLGLQNNRNSYLTQSNVGA